MLTKRECSKIIFVIGGFLCYSFADGCTFSIGIFFNEFLNIFEQSKTATAVLPGLIYAVPQFLGLFVCPLIDTIGSFYGALLGGAILSFSFFVSRFASSLEFMYITLGFFASVGLELTYVSGIMAVTKGFAEGKYLGLALGVTVSGSGIGVFIFNPLLEYLIDQFTWKGAMLVESAIFLNIIVAGCLFNYALHIYQQPKKEPQRIQIELVRDQKNYQTILRQVSHSYSAEALDTVAKEPLTMVRDRRFSVMLTKNHAQFCEPFYKPITTQTKGHSLDRRMKAAELPVDERSASFVKRLSQYGSQNIKGSRKMSQETISSQPSLTIDTPENTSHNDNTYTQSNSDVLLIPTTKSPSTFSCFLGRLRTSMWSLLSPDVWRNANILLFNFVTIFFAMSVVVVWTFSYDHSSNIGISQSSAALLVSLVGAGSCFGQIFFGYISDYVHAASLYGLGCIIAGVVTITLRYITTYWFMAILHFMFGFSQGVSYALFSVILINFSSLDLYPASLAIYLLFSGSGSLIGTTFAGYLNDWTGDYGVAYISSGSVLIVCGFIVLPLILAWNDASHTS